MAAVAARMDVLRNEGRDAVVCGDWNIGHTTNDIKAWKANQKKAFDNDAGWRIDYQLATRRLADRVVSARVERADAYALRWSDHAPVTVTYA